MTKQSYLDLLNHRRVVLRSRFRLRNISSADVNPYSKAKDLYLDEAGKNRKEQNNRVAGYFPQAPLGRA
jgi:hypothetical protein